jgi:hypothetical protein
MVAQPWDFGALWRSAYPKRVQVPPTAHIIAPNGAPEWAAEFPVLELDEEESTLERVEYFAEFGDWTWRVILRYVAQSGVYNIGHQGPIPPITSTFNAWCSCTDNVINTVTGERWSGGTFANHPTDPLRLVLEPQDWTALFYSGHRGAGTNRDQFVHLTEWPRIVDPFTLRPLYARFLSGGTYSGVDLFGYAPNPGGFWPRKTWWVGRGEPKPEL